MSGQAVLSLTAGGLVLGAGVCAWAAVSPSSDLFGRAVHRAGSARSIALTFDDGPNPAITPALLDLLDLYRARATFFMIGRHARSAPDLVREVAAHGHAIGNHTDTHPNLIWLSSARIQEQLARCQDAIAAATDTAPRWMRPPFGFRGPQLSRVLRRGGWAGMVLWTRAMFDWKPQPPDRMMRRMARVRGGEMLLMHDGDHRFQNSDRTHVLRSLEHWLPRWADAGFEFPTIDDFARPLLPAAAN